MLIQNAINFLGQPDFLEQMKTQSALLHSSSLPPEPIVVAVPEESKDA